MSNKNINKIKELIDLYNLFKWVFLIHSILTHNINLITKQYQTRAIHHKSIAKTIHGQPKKSHTHAIHHAFLCLPLIMSFPPSYCLVTLSQDTLVQDTFQSLRRTATTIQHSSYIRLTSCWASGGVARVLSSGRFCVRKSAPRAVQNEL